MNMFSIIVPVYNVEKYIDKCLDSICHQTYSNFEVIIVDDGSTDGSSKVIDYYKNKFPEKVIVVRQANEGVSSARNAGVKRAKGDYLWFIDSDDYIKYDALEKLEMILNKGNNQYDMVCFNCINISAQGKSLFKSYDVGNFSGQVQTSMNPQIILLSGVPWNKIYRRSFFEKSEIEFPTGIIYEDVPVVKYLYACSNKIFFINDFLYFYRIRSGSTMQMNICDKWLQVIDASDFLIETFKKKNLLDIYNLEIEYTVLIMILGQAKKINQINYRSEMQDILIDYLQEKYPNCLSNSYIKENELSALKSLFNKEYRSYYYKYSIKSIFRRHVVELCIKIGLYDILKHKKMGDKK